MAATDVMKQKSMEEKKCGGGWRERRMVISRRLLGGSSRNWGSGSQKVEKDAAELQARIRGSPNTQNVSPRAPTT